MSTYIYSYIEDLDTFKVQTVQKWEKDFKVSGAKKYLQNHLLRSLQDDFPVAFRAYKKVDRGYWALPRILFPYATFLGTLYKGEDKTGSALAFMEEYLGRVAESYKELAGLYYVGYRHGLLHTNMPKLFAFSGDYIGWWISFANSTENNRADFLNGGKVFYPELFYKDLCKAIDLYINDFDDPQKMDALFSNFKNGFVEMAKLHRIKDTKSKDGQRSLRKSLKFLKRPLTFRRRSK